MLQLAGPKPVAWAGQLANLTLTSSSPNLTTTFGGQAINPQVENHGNGTVTVSIPTQAGVNATTLQQLDIEAGGEKFSINVTVLPSTKPPAIPEDPVWLETFDNDFVAWNSTEGSWGFATLDDVVSKNGTGGKQRFTRASGQIAYALSPGDLTTAEVQIPTGKGYELRFASHFSGSDASVSVSYGGNFTEIYHLNSSVDADQVRIAFTPPSPPTFRFTLTSGQYWLLDDVSVVKPLGSITGAPLETIDIISDIQNIPCNKWMHDSLLPGLQKLGSASTLFLNGDLVGWDGSDSWGSFSKALTPAWKSYGDVLATAGNHEMFGGANQDTKIKHFLDNTKMGSRHDASQKAGANDLGYVGGQGLWGEHVLASGLPLIWLGSEHWWQDPDPEPEYVQLSDLQFAFLARRLEYWRARSRGVLLFTHHPLPFSVSGTWAPFEARNFGPDELRFRYLLAANPHAILITSHTHWDVACKDQNVDYRPLVGHNSTVTTLNTGATINWYGVGQDDWKAAWLGDHSPTAIRAEIYPDRIRFKALRFWNLSTDATEIQTRDVALPAQGRLSISKNLIHQNKSAAAKTAGLGGVMVVVGVMAGLALYL